MAADPDERVRQAIDVLMAADTDRDGRISWSEAAAFVRIQGERAGISGMAAAGAIRVFRALAPGKDRVAFADVERAAEAVFREIDADHDGTLSPEELNAWREQQRRAAEKQRERK
jgi:Ca2+-binding EF-hand superfamily protein